MKKGAKLTAVVLGAAAVLTAVTWKLACGDCIRDVTVPKITLPSMMGMGEVPGVRSPDPMPGGASAVDGTPRSLGRVEEALFVKGSLRGTDFPAWGTGPGEPVKPNRALRDRFDYYLLALNEASLAELSEMVLAHAERDLGAAAARDIRAVWDRYLQLQQYPFTHVARPTDLASMQAALQEHQQVRQSVLGVHWAQAFYGDEEKVLSDDLAQAQRGEPARTDPERALLQPPPGTDQHVLHQQRVERFGGEAAQRLVELDREQLAWDRRIDAARSQVERLRHAPELSASQRTAAIKQTLDAMFLDDAERLRAGGLVGED